MPKSSLTLYCGRVTLATNHTRSDDQLKTVAVYKQQQVHQWWLRPAREVG